MLSTTPGSSSAVRAGCTCSVKENRHGSGLATGITVGYLVDDECPLHGKQSVQESTVVRRLDG